MSELVAEAREDRTTFGFWVYIMTDCVLFATLFATYAVLRGGTFGGPTPHTLFDMPYVLVETILLLTSSFICGLMLLAAQAGKRTLTGALLAFTALLGVAFVTMELTEFAHLVAEQASWQRSGFLSSFFTLVGTHGLHITLGLLWALILGVQMLRFGLSSSVLRRLGLFSIFWHFLDVVWIGIFTIVYLMGVAV